MNTRRLVFCRHCTISRLAVKWLRRAVHLHAKGIPVPVQLSIFLGVVTNKVMVTAKDLRIESHARHEVIALGAAVVKMVTELAKRCARIAMTAFAAFATAIAMLFADSCLFPTHHALPGMVEILPLELATTSATITPASEETTSPSCAFLAK